MINRDFYFEQVSATLFARNIKPTVRRNQEQILDYWEKHSSKKDDRWLAYALGTAHHETDKTFGPIREYGKGKGRKYGKRVNGKVYYGRGLVQLTWDYNYKAMGKELELTLLDDPDLAFELKHAIPIMFIGMEKGIFTGKKLGSYFSKTKADWRQARRIINALDKADLIESYARRYYAAISYTT